MRINNVTRAFVLLFVAFTSTGNLVESHKTTHLLGGLGPRTDPCPCVHGSKGIVPIKAAAPVHRPTYYASETAINQAAAARECANQAAALGGWSSAPTALANDQGLTAPDLLSLGANTRVAPRFEPVGDLCHDQKTTVTPAYPGKPRMTHGHYHRHHSSKYPHSYAYESGYSVGTAGFGNDHSHSHHCSYGPHSYAYEGGHSGSYGPGSGVPYASEAYRPYSSGPTGPAVTYSSIASPAPVAVENVGPYGPVGLASPYGPGPVFAPCGCWGQGYALPYGIPGSPFGAPSVYTSLSPSSQSYNDVAGPAYGEMSLGEQENMYNGSPTAAVPVDAVSLSLAYQNMFPNIAQMTKNRLIPEERLFYGHRTTPTDGYVQQTPTITVPEERLVTVDKPIVEMKPMPCGSANEEDDVIQEAAMERERQEQSEAEAAQAVNAGPSSVITYGDLGYGPVGSSSNRFIPTPSSNGGFIHGYGGGIPCGPVGKPLPDYRAGQVIVNRGGCGCCDDSRGTDNEEPYDAPGSYENDENKGYDLYKGNKLSGSSTGGLLGRLWTKNSPSNGCSH